MVVGEWMPIHVFIDFQGKQAQIKRNIQNGAVIDLPALANGIYFIKFSSNDQSKISKTVKILKVS